MTSTSARIEEAVVRSGSGSSRAGLAVSRGFRKTVTWFQQVRDDDGSAK